MPIRCRQIDAVFQLVDCLETAPTPDANGTEKQIIELVAHQNLSILFVTDEQ